MKLCTAVTHVKFYTWMALDHISNCETLQVHVRFDDLDSLSRSQERVWMNNNEVAVLVYQLLCLLSRCKYFSRAKDRMTHCIAGDPCVFLGTRPLSVSASRARNTAATNQGRELHQGQWCAGPEWVISPPLYFRITPSAKKCGVGWGRGGLLETVFYLSFCLSFPLSICCCCFVLLLPVVVLSESLYNLL